MIVRYNLIINLSLALISIPIFTQIGENQSIYAFTKPIFHLNYPDKKIIISATESYLSGEKVFSLNDVSLVSESRKNLINLNASKATLNNNKNYLILSDEVELISEINESKMRISSNEIKYEIKRDILTSTEQSVTTYDNTEISSLSFQISLKNSGLVAHFQNGNISINNENNYSSGNAKKIIIHTDKNELILEGEAQLNQMGLIMRSDTIYFDLTENKIIKSINSRIESSS